MTWIWIGILGVLLFLAGLPPAGQATVVALVVVLLGAASLPERRPGRRRYTRPTWRRRR